MCGLGRRGLAGSRRATVDELAGDQQADGEGDECAGECANGSPGSADENTWSIFIVGTRAFGDSPDEAGRGHAPEDDAHVAARLVEADLRHFIAREPVFATVAAAQV